MDLPLCVVATPRYGEGRMAVGNEERETSSNLSISKVFAMTPMRSLVAVGLGCFAATHAAAQSPAPAWTFVVTPYVWTSGLTGNIGFNNIETNVNLGFSDILHHLNFGLMASGEARHGPYILGLDGLYISVGDSKVVGIRNASAEVSLDQHETILQPTVGYAFDRTAWSVDAILGARYWRLSTDLGIDPARLQDRTRSGTKSWIDGTIGARLRLRPMSNLHVDLAGDGGGGSSRNSWGAAGNVGLDLSKRYNITAGYRYLSVDYDREGYLFDTHMDGFVLAAKFNF